MKKDCFGDLYKTFKENIDYNITCKIYISDSNEEYPNIIGL